MDKSEKYFQRALRYIEEDKNEKAFKSLKLIKNKTDEIVIYEIFCLIRMCKFIQAINKVNSFDFSRVYKIVARQCERYIGLLDIGINEISDNQRKSLSEEIKLNENEIKTFLDNHDSFFKTIFSSAKIFFTEKEDNLNQLISKIKKEDEVTYENFTYLSIANPVFELILNYVNDDFREVTKIYYSLEDNRLICKTIYGISLCKIGKKEAAEKILKEVLDKETEEKIKPTGYNSLQTLAPTIP